MIVLIDGDILLCKACFAAEERRYNIYNSKGQTIAEFKWASDVSKYLAQNAECTAKKVRKVKDFSVVKFVLWNLIKKTIGALKEHVTGIDSVIIYVGSKESGKTFRHELATTQKYKGNRKEINRPAHIEDAREYMLQTTDFQDLFWDCGIMVKEVSKFLETDDQLGIVQCSSDGQSIIVSIDKDLLQIPGMHYNMDTCEISTVEDPGDLWLTKRKDGKTDLKGCGLYWFLAQLLLGDSIDNIKKPKKGLGAKKIFKEYTERKDLYKFFSYVKLIYAESKMDIEENASLLWIRRKPQDYWGDWI